ncbi:hypothetical protein RE474_02585 [Methanolobus sediminis]|uniref:Uncharacterized protein n=1 Tax=Methanolobus sediminis TaxID=3072978 RepID=A0AA51UL77_9EURY|nr:hypothetical protein [Methanolobus sediminis]WMW25628.1 hypothetical protein RE474_02585 [Methanolobus sediminis]
MQMNAEADMSFTLKSNCHILIIRDNYILSYMRNVKKVLIMILILLIAAAYFDGTEESGGENYNGEDGEQPGIGVDIGPGKSNADDQGDRTRFKDR